MKYTKVIKKIVKLNQLKEIIYRYKQQGKTVGLVTGCFDILHLGHLRLLEFAKDKVDVVVVGLDSDLSIKLTKGKNRPIFTQKVRLEQMEALEHVDYVFGIMNKLSFENDQIKTFYNNLTQKLSPTHLITSVESDKYWNEKKERAKKLGIKFIGQKGNNWGSTSKIIDELVK